ncbi:MAG: hypothetical protein RMY29_021435 [Nostoc sp. CreGUA01]|nr:hypothetical protein [Nostoc sp. CreGUA01]
MGINITILRKVNSPETVAKDEVKRTNNNFHQLALFAPTYNLRLQLKRSLFIH